MKFVLSVIQKNAKIYRAHGFRCQKLGRFPESFEVNEKVMLSKYFKRHEFTCRCGCGFNSIDTDLLDKLLDIRKHFGRPVSIESGNRCPTHNHAVGGEPRSFHPRGRAADIKVKNIPPSDVADYLEKKYKTCCGIGRYNSFTHLDNRSCLVRWDFRK